VHSQKLQLEIAVRAKPQISTPNCICAISNGPHIARIVGRKDNRQSSVMFLTATQITTY